MSSQKLGGCQNDKPWGLVIRKSAHLLMTPDILSFTHYTSGAHWGTRSNSLWSETSRCLSRLTGILRLLGSKTNQQVHITSDEVLLSTQGLPIPLLHFFSCTALAFMFSSWPVFPLLLLFSHWNQCFKVSTLDLVYLKSYSHFLSCSSSCHSSTSIHRWCLWEY